MVITHGLSKGIFQTMDNIINIINCIFQHVEECLVHNRWLIICNKAACKITTTEYFFISGAVIAKLGNNLRGKGLSHRQSMINPAQTGGKHECLQWQ